MQFASHLSTGLHPLVIYSPIVLRSLVTALFSLLLLLTWRSGVRIVELPPVLPVAFLLYYAIGMVLLVSTMQRGGELVHELGL